MQNSGIAEDVSGYLIGNNWGLLFPFILCAAIKTAQGSSTVALITTASIVAPLLADLSVISEWDKALCVLSIGAGSLVVSHANDSAFWVMSQMSGIPPRIAFKTYTLGTLLVGLFAFSMIYVLSFIL